MIFHEFIDVETQPFIHTLYAKKCWILTIESWLLSKMAWKYQKNDQKLYVFK